MGKVKNYMMDIEEKIFGIDGFENKISDIRFNGVRIDDSRIKIYGAIPQVRSLADKYPMDKIYVYK